MPALLAWHTTCLALPDSSQLPPPCLPARRPAFFPGPQDSDLNGVVDVRYTGGARMLLLVEVGSDRWRIKIPVMVSGE